MYYNRYGPLECIENKIATTVYDKGIKLIVVNIE
jgi:hypothetical protein